MSNRTVYHILPDDEGWKIKQAGSSRASAITDTKPEALDQARKFIDNAGGLAQIKVHKRDGTIQTEFTYGEDPRKYEG